MNRLRNFANLVNDARAQNFANLVNGATAQRRTSDGADANEMSQHREEDTPEIPEGSAEDVPPPIGDEDANGTENGIRRRSPTGTGGDDDGNGREPSFWDAEDDVANEERRREAIRNEIERSQRSNFVHFVLLCLVPTSLLLIVVASVLGESDACSGYPTTCANEPRSFINAFTTRCICDAVVAKP